MILPHSASRQYSDLDCLFCLLSPRLLLESYELQLEAAATAAATAEAAAETAAQDAVAAQMAAAMGVPVEAAPAQPAVDEDWQWLVEQLQQPENKQLWEQLQATVETAAVETAAVETAAVETAAAVKAAAVKAKEAARKKLQRCKKKKKTVDS